MSKILKNNTGSTITIVDVGSVTILASPGSYTIPPQDYLLWAQSSDIIAFLNDASPTPSITVTDGSFDLNVSDGVDLIKGIHPRLNIQDPLINAVSVPTANTEVSFALPAFTRLLMIQARTTGLIKVGFEAASTDGLNYLTLFPGMYAQWSLNVESPLTLYFQSPSASQIVEINHWT